MNDYDIDRQQKISEDKMLRFEENYRLRTWTSGCYYYNERLKAWVSDGMEIRENHYNSSHCLSDHLTSFGGGFFVIPNDIDFDYIFANASFEDHLTIYIAILIILVLQLLFSIWAR